MAMLQRPVKRFFFLIICIFCLLFAIAIIFQWRDQDLWITLFQRSKNTISLSSKNAINSNLNNNLTQGTQQTAKGINSQGMNYTLLKGLAEEKLKNITLTSCQNNSPLSKATRRKKQLRKPKNYTCQDIFSGFYKYLAELETLDWESDHSLSKLKQPLPNFFLSSFTKNTTVETYRRANAAFVHLPKSGGTSVEDYFRGHAKKGDWEMLLVPHCESFQRAACKAATTPKQHFFYSKRTYGLHSFLASDRPFLYFTWFRDPVSRVVSTYYYLNQTRPESHHYSRKYIVPSRNLTSFLHQSKGVQYPQFDNFNVRLLQFGDDHVLDENFEECCGTNLKEIPAVNETHYKTAKKNLENMAFIGNMDDWRTSQEMLDLMFDFKTIETETHSNANPHKLELTSYERGEIERRNQWDILLHADAMEIYVRQKKAYLLYKTSSERV